ncbi:hypothetical protein OG440_39405 (plasmid) [Streptomyces sp. NBC_00637]|uniref:hypothetical protein n=1 Tax=Streptomyces sp. NBC_00637 TaxID=2903667 RepID=UPI002F90D01A
MSQFLYALPALACPVGMGAMMWFMMKGNRQPAQDKTAGHAGFTTDPREQEVDALRKEINDLRGRVDSPSDAPAERTR